MARRVADLRLALDIVAAPGAGDPWWVPAPLRGPSVDGPVRVAVVTDPAGAGIDPHVRAGIDRAADWLADAGYDVVDAQPPHVVEAATAWADALWADFGTLWPDMEAVAGPEQVEFLRSCLEHRVFKAVDQAAQRDTWIAVNRLGAAWERFARDHPITLGPVCCERPWLIGDDVTRVEDIATSMRMVVAVSILGLPSCAVPVGCDDGLPQGVQLVGARFREDLLLDAAQALEDRAPHLTPMRAPCR